MNSEGSYETGMYEAEGRYGEGETPIGLESAAGGMMPHPMFGESGEYQEIPADYVPHPVFGLVRSIRGGGAAAEVNEQEEEILGRDERFPITNTTIAPYRWICFVETTFPVCPGRPGPCVAIGSGVLISPRHVLTSGHNLIDPVTRAAATSIKVSPGCQSRANRPFKFQVTSTWRASNEWQATFDARFDYGLITLPSPIGNIPQRVIGGHTFDYWGKPGTGTLLVPIQPNSTRFRGTRVTVSGYPGDKPMPNGGEQWAANGQVVNVNPAGYGPELIFYTSDSCGGQSGGPVWFRRGNQLCLFAIHTGSCALTPPSADCIDVGPTRCKNHKRLRPPRRETSSNRAVLWSPTVAARVRGWMGP